MAAATNDINVKLVRSSSSDLWSRSIRVQVCERVHASPGIWRKRVGGRRRRHDGHPRGHTPPPDLDSRRCSQHRRRAPWFSVEIWSGEEWPHWPASRAHTRFNLRLVQCLYNTDLELIWSLCRFTGARDSNKT